LAEDAEEFDAVVQARSGDSLPDRLFLIPGLAGDRCADVNAALGEQGDGIDQDIESPSCPPTDRR
jgi:hypothetical protein